MDTVMNLTVYGEKAASALENAEKELHTLDESILSRTAEGSELSALNAANGESVSYAADDPLPKLIETALAISEATDGALALRDDRAARGTNFELIFVTDDGRVLYTGGLAAAFTPNEESGYTYESLA